MSDAILLSSIKFDSYNPSLIVDFIESHFCCILHLHLLCIVIYLAVTTP
jgi:hypothetical protein